MDGEGARLARLEDDGSIDYSAFLQRFQIRLKGPYGQWQRAVLRTLYNSLLAADMQMDELMDGGTDGWASAIARDSLASALESLIATASEAEAAEAVICPGLPSEARGANQLEQAATALLVKLNDSHILP